MILDNEDFEVKSSNSYWAGRLIDLPKDDAWEIADEIAETIEYALRQENGSSTSDEALHIANVVAQSEQLKAFADYAQKRMWEDEDKDLSEFVDEFLRL